MGEIERIQLATGDRERLEKLMRDRNTLQKVVVAGPDRIAGR